MVGRAFWDGLADDGGPSMTHRQARRIIREQRQYCRVRMDGDDLICTGGTKDHDPELYRLALQVHFQYEPALPEPHRPKFRRKAEA